MQLFIDRFPSSLGEIRLIFAGDFLRALDWEDHQPRMRSLLERHYPGYELAPAPAPKVIGDPLAAYFEGDIAAIDTVPVKNRGTSFQEQVWAALRRIPAGTTMSYGELAASLGRPKAMRAVGLANGSNPVGIVVPCHRVIGADGSLTGYGGGIERKRWLLAHERSASLRFGSTMSNPLYNI